MATQSQRAAASCKSHKAPETGVQQSNSDAPTIVVSPTSNGQSTRAGPPRHTATQALNLPLTLTSQRAGDSEQQYVLQPASSFQMLLIVFARLCAESYPFSGEIPEDFVLLKEWEQGLPQTRTSAAAHFLRWLPHIRDPRSIPADEARCMICNLPFATYTTQFRGTGHSRNVARALPCGHFFCCECIQRYIEPYRRTQKDTCPFCHSILFVKWMQFHDLTRLPSPFNLHGWAEKDNASKIQVFWKLLRPTQSEYNEAFKHWQAEPLARYATSGYGTKFEPDFVTKTASISSTETNPEIISHQRVRKEIHFRAVIIEYMQDWVKWRRNPGALRPTLGPNVLADLFKLRREQEWDPTERHEANARRHGGIPISGDD